MNSYVGKCNEKGHAYLPVIGFLSWADYNNFVFPPETGKCPFCSQETQYNANYTVPSPNYKLQIDYHNIFIKETLHETTENIYPENIFIYLSFILRSHIIQYLRRKILSLNLQLKIKHNMRI